RSNQEDSQPAFSPDGEQIAFRSERDGGGIFVMNATGESVRRVTDFGFNPSWSADGKEIVTGLGRFPSPNDIGSQEVGMFVVNATTGAKRQVLGGTRALQPAWSPHGHRIAFWGLRGGSGQRDIWTIAADGSDMTSGGVAVATDSVL